MLEFAENLLRDIKGLRQETEQLVINGSIKDMEQYSRLMGRLEGYRFTEDAIRERLRKGSEEFD